MVVTNIILFTLNPSFIYISIWRVLRINACYSRLDPDLIPFMRHLWVPACAGMTE